MSTEQNGPQNEPKKPVDNGLSLAQAFNLAWQFGYTMAIPLVVLAIGGRLLDKYLNTSPLFILIGIFVSIIISSILVGMKAVKIIQGLSDKNEPDTSTKSQDDKRDNNSEK
ncbi:MAG: AtpZ/AtpI family protein [Patescibacteria group bacterium]|nr:AtpZ/AtpI family protein [Patescibacteria group bacterium]